MTRSPGRDNMRAAGVANVTNEGFCPGAAKARSKGAKERARAPFRRLERSHHPAPVFGANEGKVMLFWTVAAILALGISALLARAMLRGHLPEAEDGEKASDMRVYRDQLAELERDVARGVVRAEDGERTRVEIARRMLEADRRGGAVATPGPGGLDPAVMACMGVVVIGGALALYAAIGAPQYPDMPLAERIAQADQMRQTRMRQAEAEAEFARPAPPVEGVDAEFLDLMEKLRAAVAENPDDLRGQMLLSRNEAMLGDFRAAHAAQSRVIELRGEAASAGDYADLAFLLVQAAGGFVSPEAETALRAALERDPKNGPARYYLGLLHVQTRRPDLAFRVWRDLMADSRPDAPWMAPITAQIEQVADLAGVDFALPAATPATPPRGPSAADMDAAAEMSDEERAEMIRGMVAGLAERLATDGGPPQDWARLIDAYGVLGETGRAGEIWTEAQVTFAGSPEALAVIGAAAARAGVGD